MRFNDRPARPRSHAVGHSLRRTLLAALVVTTAPVLVVLALSVPGLALAFVAGLASGGVLATQPHRVDRALDGALTALRRRLQPSR